ncbi:MAG: hypothetical protein ACKVQU_32190 [Burkholderiales bacterium]
MRHLIGLAGCGGGGGGNDASASGGGGGGGAGGGGLTNEQALDQAKVFLAAYDASLTTISATGAEFFAQFDACYRDLGRTKAYRISAFDDRKYGLSRNSQAYQRNSTRINVALNALRTTANPDRSSRTEIDIAYDVAYPLEGTSTRFDRTLVTGSTTGVCPTGENKAQWRFLGDQKIAYHNLVAMFEGTRNYSILTGTETSGTARRAIRFDVRDADEKLTYAVVSHNGGTRSLKLISPRLLESHPLLAGKIGNFSGYTPEDPFRICTTTAGSNNSDALLADCTVGSTFQDWGSNISATPNLDGLTPANISTGDTSFADLQFAAGMEYTFRLYNDDGWKTVNGQAGKTPIATYTTKLERLPYTFETIMGATSTFGTASDRIKSLTNAQIGAAFSGTGASLTEAFPAWTASPDGRKFGQSTVFVIGSGPAAATVSPAVWPAIRTVEFYFPVASSAAAPTLTLNLPGQPASMRAKTGGQIANELSDRGTTLIRVFERWQ